MINKINKYFIYEVDMFRLGIIILILISYIGLSVFIESANPCSIFNNKESICNSNMMGQ